MTVLIFILLYKHSSWLDGESSVQKEQDDTLTNLNTQLANTFEAVPDSINIGDVVENVQQTQNISIPHFSQTAGFPKAKRRDVCRIFMIPYKN